MTKRKLLTGALSLSMVAILAVGGTLAYFTDTDSADNVFTVGNVEITLDEVFDENNAKLLPTTGKDAEGNIENAIQKEVWVTSYEDNSYVRVHIAIPALLDDGDPSFDASANLLHFNYAEEAVAAGQWDWSKSSDDGMTTGNWNFYEQKIDGIDYNVYVVTYTSVLDATNGPAKTATPAMHQVYLDAEVTNADIAKYTEALGEWKIKVLAEGAQATGFDNAHEALNTAFGTPGAYNPWDKE